MSANKHKLHDRAMKLFYRIAHYGSGLPYCTTGGIGPCKELDYLIKRDMVHIVRLCTYSPFGMHINISRVQVKP